MLAGNNNAPQGCSVFRSKDGILVDEAALREPAWNNGVSALRHFFSSLACLMELGHGWAFPKQSDAPMVPGNLLTSALPPIPANAYRRAGSLSRRALLVILVILVAPDALEGERPGNYSVQGLCDPGVPRRGRVRR